jgi:hypothetical protein
MQTLCPSFISALDETKVNSTDALCRKRLRRDLLHDSILQAQHPVAAAREVKIVSGDQRGQLLIVMQLRDQLEDRVRSAIIEVPGRLIRQQDLRLDNEGPG